LVRDILGHISDDALIEITSKNSERNILSDIPRELYGEDSESVIRTMKLYHDVVETESNRKRVLIMSHFAGRK
jgi:hypothetical protein